MNNYPFKWCRYR